MKIKILFTLITSILIMIFLVDWHTNNLNEEPIVAADEVLLIIDLDTQDQIYQVSMDYLIDEKIVGDVGTRNADCTPLAENDRICNSIKKGVDLDAGLDIRKLSVQFYVTDFINDFGDHNREYKVENEISLVAEYGNVYYITVAGDKENGYTAFLKTVDKN